MRGRLCEVLRPRGGDGAVGPERCGDHRGGALSYGHLVADVPARGHGGRLGASEFRCMVRFVGVSLPFRYPIVYMVKGVGLNGTIASVLEQIGYSVADIVAKGDGVEMEEAEAAAREASGRPSVEGKAFVSFSINSTPPIEQHPQNCTSTQTQNANAKRKTQTQQRNTKMQTQRSNAKRKTQNEKRKTQNEKVKRKRKNEKRKTETKKSNANRKTQTKRSYAKRKTPNAKRKRKTQNAHAERWLSGFCPVYHSVLRSGHRSACRKDTENIKIRWPRPCSVA